MVQSGVDLAVGGVDRVGAPRRRVGVRLTDDADEWPEETQPKLDQQDAEFQSDRSHAVASALADTLDETFGAELAEVVPKLAEAVLVTGEAMAGDDARRRRMGERAYETSRGRYSWPALAERVAEVYAEVADAAPTLP